MLHVLRVLLNEVAEVWSPLFNINHIHKHALQSKLIGAFDSPAGDEMARQVEMFTLSKFEVYYLLRV